MGPSHARSRSNTEKVSIFLVLCLSCVSCHSTNDTSSKMAKELATSSRRFAVDAFHALRKVQEGNLFFSPFSISSAFGMVFAGAKSSTEDEISRVLHLGKDPSAVHVAFKELLGTIKDNENVTLETANRVYVQEGFKVLDEYLEKVKTFYLSQVQTANFADDAERVKINKWVEDVTRQKIKELLPSGSVNSLTRLVLVNAIYFKGNWASQFDPAHTQPKPFHLNNSTSIDVPMMSRKGNYARYHFKELNADIVELPYKGETMSMILIIPREIEGLKDVEAALNHEMIEKLFTTQPSKPELTLFVPKFKLESSFSLKTPLSALGMAAAFDATSADFSGITGDRSLYVSEGYHKAFLEVNEEGSEAAAATGVVMLMRAMPLKMEVKADRPFLVMIREKSTGSILFMGKLVKPDKN